MVKISVCFFRSLLTHFFFFFHKLTQEFRMSDVICCFCIPCNSHFLSGFPPSALPLHSDNSFLHFSSVQLFSLLHCQNPSFHPPLTCVLPASLHKILPPLTLRRRNDSIAVSHFGDCNMPNLELGKRTDQIKSS